MIRFEWKLRTPLGLLTSAEIETRSRELKAEFARPGFFENYPELTLVFDSESVLEMSVLEPIQLLEGLLGSFEKFLAGAAVVVAEEEESWLIRRHGEEAVLWSQADFALSASIGSGAYVSEAILNSREAEIQAWRTISMDLRSWLTGICALGRQYLAVVRLGLPVLLGKADAEEGERVARIVQFETFCGSAIEVIEHWLAVRPDMAEFFFIKKADESGKEEESKSVD